MMVAARLFRDSARCDPELSLSNDASDRQGRWCLSNFQLEQLESARTAGATGGGGINNVGIIPPRALQSAAPHESAGLAQSISGRGSDTGASAEEACASVGRVCVWPGRFY